MIRRAYPEYKPSGVEWLGEIPEHWDVKRLKFLISESLKYGANEVAELDDLGLPRYIRITDIDESGALRGETFKSLPEDVARPYLLQEGDLLLARSGATVGKSFYYEKSWGRAAYAGYLIRARFNPDRIEPRFVNYFTNSAQYWQWLNSSLIQATIQNVSAEKYANLILSIPASNDQRAIVAFLDRETARIDTLIEKKQRQIELLQEKRTALISHAVTKGLNPKAKKKDSSIEWLGEIPKHWESSPLKRNCVLVGRIGFRGYSTEDIVPENEGAITLSPSNMKDGGIDLEKCTYLAWNKYYESPEIMVFNDDILIVKTGSTYGKVAYVSNVDCPATINPQIMILKKSKVVPKYLYFIIATNQFHGLLRELNTGSTIPTMTQEAVGRIGIPIPPIAEQIAIVFYLDRETARIGGLTDKIRGSIDTLREYRTALISAAVTGKIDVRKEVA